MNPSIALRTLATVGLVGAAAVFSLQCGGPDIRCVNDENCLEDQICDTRQGLCVAADGGTPTDVPEDGGQTDDAGTNDDAGTMDAGTGMDAGLDAGMQMDAGTDAGMQVDAGIDAGTDAGMPLPDGGSCAGTVCGGNCCEGATPACDTANNTCYECTTANATQCTPVAERCCAAPASNGTCVATINACPAP